MYTKHFVTATEILFSASAFSFFNKHPFICELHSFLFVYIVTACCHSHCGCLLSSVSTSTSLWSLYLFAYFIDVVLAIATCAAAAVAAFTSTVASALGAITIHGKEVAAVLVGLT